MNLKYLLLRLVFLIIIEVRSSYSDGFYDTCNGSFKCGSISGFKYPFRRHQDPAHCGYPGFELKCDEGDVPTIDIMNLTYQVLNFDPTAQVLRVIRKDMIASICPQNLVNTTIDHGLFDYTPSYVNISFLFKCPIAFDVLGMIGSVICGNNVLSPVFLVPGVQGPGICETSVVVPFPAGFVNSTGLVQVLQDGFEIRWKVESTPCSDCTQSGGQCVYDAGRTTCACPESTFLADTCSSANKTEAKISPSSSPASSSGLSPSKCNELCSKVYCMRPTFEET